MAKEINETVTKSSHYQDKMIEHLNKQEQVIISLEKRQGDPPYETVILNDVKYVIPRGESTTVPKQVADVLNDKLRAEGKLRLLSEEQKQRMSNPVKGTAIKL